MADATPAEDQGDFASSKCIPFEQFVLLVGCCEVRDESECKTGLLFGVFDSGFPCSPRYSLIALLHSLAPIFLLPASRFLARVFHNLIKNDDDDERDNKNGGDGEVIEKTFQSRFYGTAGDPLDQRIHQAPKLIDLGIE